MKSKVPLVSALLSIGISTAVFAESWPTWRGDIAGSGSTADAELPTEWGPEKNVKWRVTLPDRGNSTPVISQGKVFVAQAIEADKFRGLLCFDRKDGKQLWKAGVTYDKEESTHKDNPYCSASPATDGSHVYVSFGSAGFYCYDLDGKEVWHRDFGPIDHVWGNSSSPVLFGDLCIHYHGPGKGGFLTALNKKTGETVWKVDEPVWKTGERTDGFKGQSGEGVIGSFSTPIIVNTGERTELIMSFPMEMRAYAPDSGKELWRCQGLNPLIYTSPLYSDGIVIAMGGYYGNSIGVRTGGTGDVTETHRLWQEVRHDGGIGSGVIKDGHIYFQDAGGIAYCLELKTGKTKWEERLPGKGKSWGSFVLAGENIYTLSQPGDSVIFKADPDTFEPIAQSDLKEHTNASIAPSDGELFIRTYDSLWCISSSN